MRRITPCTEQNYGFAHDLTKRNMQGYVAKYWGGWNREIFLQAFQAGSNFLIMEAEQPVGYLRIVQKGEEGIFLDDLQILPEKQRQGMGSWALQQLFKQYAAAGFLWLDLRVFHENPAKALYLREGFSVIETNEISSFLRRSLSEKREVFFRQACVEDLPKIVEMLADDALGAQRENATTPLPASYLSAFHAIADDPNNEIIIAQLDTQIVGTLQITYIPNLSYQGGWRAQIEGVRIDKAHRASGIGRQLIQHAIQRAKERGCILLQLTSTQTRLDAIRFYESLGFTASHVGMKRKL